MLIQRYCLVVAAAVAVDALQAPLFVGGEDDAGMAAVGIEPPGDAALAIELVASGAGEDHAVGGIGGDGIGGGNGVHRGGRRCGLGGDGGSGRLRGFVAEGVQFGFIDDDLAVGVGIAEELHRAGIRIVARGDPARIDDIGQPDDGQEYDELEKTFCHRMRRCFLLHNFNGPRLRFRVHDGWFGVDLAVRQFCMHRRHDCGSGIGMSTLKRHRESS